MAIAGKVYIDENGKKSWHDNQSRALALPIEQQMLLQAGQVSINDLIDYLEQYRFTAQQLSLLGYAAARLGNAWITEMSFTEAIELEPDYAQAYGDVISFHAARQQWETCQEFWKQGMLKASEKSYIRNRYARALYLQERYAEAMVEATEGLKEKNYQDEELTLLLLHASLGTLTADTAQERNKLFRDGKLQWLAARKRFPHSQEIAELEKLFGLDEFE